MTEKLINTEGSVRKMGWYASQEEGDEHGTEAGELRLCWEIRGG